MRTGYWGNLRTALFLMFQIACQISVDSISCFCITVYKSRSDMVAGVKYGCSGLRLFLSHYETWASGALIFYLLIYNNVVRLFGDFRKSEAVSSGNPGWKGLTERSILNLSEILCQLCIRNVSGVIGLCGLMIIGLTNGIVCGFCSWWSWWSWWHDLELLCCPDLLISEIGDKKRRILCLKARCMILYVLLFVVSRWRKISCNALFFRCCYDYIFSQILDNLIAKEW